MSGPSRPADDGLDEATLREALRARDPDWGGELLLLDSTGSSNDEARRLARAGAPHGSIVLAREQTQGRGRNGAVWYSPPADNLYLSVLLRPSMRGASASSFALVVGLVVAGAVQARLGPNQTARVKWPNDVLVAGKKLAGVLIEAQIQAGELASLVVGIGVNVSTRDFPGPLADTATSLAREGANEERTSLAAELASGVIAAAGAFGRGGLAPFLKQLQELDALRGRRVRVDEITGVATGIDAGGRLLIQTADGERAVASGHIEIVPG